MFHDLKFAYLALNLIFAIVWVVLFFARKDLRRQMTVMSLLVAPMGPLSELLYLKDYWTPNYFFGYPFCIEDLLWAFLIGGIAAVLYEELIGKKYSKQRVQKHPWWPLVFVLVLILWMIIGNMVMGFNSIYVSVAAMLVFGIIIISLRHDLLKDALYSGILVSALILISYLIFIPLFPGVIQQWWYLNNISGILILDAPIEELIWGFGWGILAGPIYEFTVGLKFRSR